MDRRNIIIGGIVAWVLALYTLAFFLPVYIDEVGYEYLLGRFFREDGFSLTVWPQCESAFKQAVPTLWVIPRMVTAFFYDTVPSLTWLRFAGAIGAAINTFLVFKILQGVAAPHQSRAVSIFVAGLTAGTLPFMSVMARPEGLMLFLILGSILISLRGVTARGRISGTSLSGLCILLSAYFGAAIHPLGVVALPLFIAAFLHGHKLTRIHAILLLVVGMASFVSAEYHSHASRCPEVPFLDRFLSLYTGAGGHAPFSQFGERLLHTIRYYLSLVRALDVDSNYPFGFLENDVTRQASGLLVMVSRFLTSAWLVLLLLLFVKAFPWRRIELRAAYKRSDPLVLVIGLLLSFALFVATQPEPAAYRLTILAPLFVVAVGILIFRLREDSSRSASLAEFSRLFAISALSSSALTVAVHGSTIIETLGLDVTKTNVLYQSHPFARLSTGLAEVAIECGFADAPQSRRILVDNVTYWAFRHTTEPLFVEFTANDLLPLEKGKMAGRIQELGASGYATRCESVNRFDLPPPAHREGSFCCAMLK